MPTSTRVESAPHSRAHTRERPASTSAPQRVPRPGVVLISERKGWGCVVRESCYASVDPGQISVAPWLRARGSRAFPWFALTCMHGTPAQVGRRAVGVLSAPPESRCHSTACNHRSCSAGSSVGSILPLRPRFVLQSTRIQLDAGPRCPLPPALVSDIARYANGKEFAAAVLVAMGTARSLCAERQWAATPWLEWQHGESN